MPFSKEYIDKVSKLLETFKQFQPIEEVEVVTKPCKYIVKSDYLHQYIERIPFNFGTIAYQTVNDRERATEFTEEEIDRVMFFYPKGWIKVKVE